MRNFDNQESFSIFRYSDVSTNKRIEDLTKISKERIYKIVRKDEIDKYLNE
jgi:hypothetical protein